MHRFFVDEAGFQGGIARLEESDARHAQRVLRLNPGEEVVLMDGHAPLFRRNHRHERRRDVPHGTGAAVQRGGFRITCFRDCPRRKR